MPLRFSLREHDYSATHTPQFEFMKQADSVLRINRSAGWGDGYAFIVANREWLNGKYLRFLWRSDVFWSFIAAVLIYDGEYTRSSGVDFPGNAPLLLKGNGLLQTVITRSSSFGWTTDDVQANTAGGSESSCTIFFKLRVNQNYTPAVYLDVDWFEINSAPGGSLNLFGENFTDPVIMEKTGSWGDYGYISTGDIVPSGARELGASFDVGQGSTDLAAQFESGQDSATLQAGFLAVIPDSEQLVAEFTIRRAASGNLPAAMYVLWIGDLKANFRVEKTYDLRGTAGIAFYWWGANNPPSALNQVIVETGPGNAGAPVPTPPTGFWYSDFYDGPARLRHVFIPWGSFTWVPSPQRLLEPHRHGFEEPDKSRITGFLITIHTTGKRRIDFIYAPFMVEFLAKFIIRRSTSRDFLGKIIVRHPGSQNLPGKFIVRRSTSRELAAGFLIRQEAMDLAAEFYAHHKIEELELPAKFIVTRSEIEDFEDAILVDHYQHYSGNGFRDTNFPHTGTYSWRTREGQNDIFDISNGGTLSYAKVEVWSRYGNGTRKIELLDSAFNTLAQTTWGFISGYHQKSVEHTGPVKYFRITCPAGANSGLWTDDIEIRWG
jgi:hypothetical protein